MPVFICRVCGDRIEVSHTQMKLMRRVGGNNMVCSAPCAIKALDSAEQEKGMKHADDK